MTPRPTTLPTPDPSIIWMQGTPVTPRATALSTAHDRRLLSLKRKDKVLVQALWGTVCRFLLRCFTPHPCNLRIFFCFNARHLFLHPFHTLLYPPVRQKHLTSRQARRNGGGTGQIPHHRDETLIRLIQSGARNKSGTLRTLQHAGLGSRFEPYHRAPLSGHVRYLHKTHEPTDPIFVMKDHKDRQSDLALGEC